MALLYIERSELACALYRTQCLSIKKVEFTIGGLYQLIERAVVPSLASLAP